MLLTKCTKTFFTESSNTSSIYNKSNRNLTQKPTDSNSSSNYTKSSSNDVVKLREKAPSSQESSSSTNRQSLYTSYIRPAILGGNETKDTSKKEKQRHTNYESDGNKIHF